MPRSRRKREPENLLEFKKLWGIKQFPRKAHPKELPDTTKHFYPRKPFRPRLDITLDEIKDILLIGATEAREIVKEIKGKSYKSKYPFITIKEFARYTKLKIWQIHHYFITCEMFERNEIREKHKRGHH